MKNALNNKPNYYENKYFLDIFHIYEIIQYLILFQYMWLDILFLKLIPKFKGKSIRTDIIIYCSRHCIL